jgi:hypothetical protein
VNEVEVVLTLETRDPAHRDQVAPALRAQGFRAEAYPALKEGGTRPGRTK